MRMQSAESVVSRSAAAAATDRSAGASAHTRRPRRKGRARRREPGRAELGRQDKTLRAAPPRKHCSLPAASRRPQNHCRPSGRRPPTRRLRAPPPPTGAALPHHVQCVHAGRSLLLAVEPLSTWQTLKDSYYNPLCAGARPYVSVRYGGGRRDAASRAGRRHSPSAAAPHPRCRHVVPWRHEPSPRACSLSDRIMESGADLDSQLIARDVTLMENTSFEVPLTSHVTPVTLLPQPTQFHVGWKLNSTPMEKKAARCNIISYPASSQLHNSHTANINKWSVFALLVI
ncbi:uncharacterized protein LOC126354768 isoform X1 [Schistocerca gregaria]|uniref:uncharacterized protein LOC126354768 isoform X1 n=1 Tax=Schistocerca gregaria TaxID=7010 RepID=UPI00211DD2DF|nr:uncharacterized protein LOC126354768 isoform X1 [Schistocerca gregaria]